MQELIVDARGEVCPKPLIMTKKALKEKPGEFLVLLDNRTSWENVSRFLSDNGIAFSSSEGAGEYRLSVSTDGQALSHPDAASYCQPPDEGVNRTGYVIAFTRATMGEGPEELGRILIQGFCNTIGEMDPLPQSLIFYNSGVSLVRKDSPVAGSFRELAERGVEILVCGTCTDYFDLKQEISVGTISNMYTIMESLTRAGHVITP